jgi:hypothetical protein
VPSALVLDPFEDAVVDELGQPLGQHRPRDVEVRTQVGEPPHPEEAVTQHEHRPAFADDLQRARERAVLAVVVLSESHVTRISVQSPNHVSYSSMNEPRETW